MNILKVILLGLLVGQVAVAQPRVGGFGTGGKPGIAPHKSLIVLGLNTNVPDCDGAALKLSNGVPITVTRSSSAYCTKPDGTIVLLSANQPRVTRLNNESMLMLESSATNLFLQSEDISVAPWAPYAIGYANPTITTNAATAPNGTLTADRLEIPQVTAAGATAIYQQFTAPLAGAYIYSCYIKGTSSSGTIKLSLFDSGLAAAYGDMTVSYTTSWQRFSMNATLTAVAYNFFIGTYNWSGPVQGVQPAADIHVWGCQIEYDPDNHTTPTSYIATTTTTVTRSSEIASFPTPSGLSDTEGCAAISFRPSWTGINPASASRGILQNGSLNHFFYSAGLANTVGSDNGTVGSTVAASFVSTSTKRYIATWSGSKNQLITTEATTPTVGAPSPFAALATLDATMYIGASSDAEQSNVIYVSKIKLGRNPNSCR